MRQLYQLAMIGFLWLALTSCSPARGIYHTVEPGQTLYRISRTYGVDEKYLARLNGIEDPTQLRVGERIFVPGVAREKHVPATVGTAPVVAAKPAPAATPAPSRSPKAPSPSVKPQPAPRPTVKSPPPSPSPADKGRFIWPLKGQILRKFGQKGSGPSKGIEISAGKGSPILSVAAGRVIYSGDGIRSYGNLIIVKHEDNLFSVYGYNQQNLVKDGTFVGKGDKIAAVGVPPGGGAPRLYFEVRRGKTAVDPLFYLP